MRLLLLPLSGLLLATGTASASTDSAQIRTPYFRAQSDFSGVSGYAAAWGHWIKVYRAIQETPSLRRELQGCPPGSGNLASLCRRLSAQTVARQNSAVYVLKIGNLEGSSGLRWLLRGPWKRVGESSVYGTVPKQVLFTAQSESDTKREPLYVYSSNPQDSARVCYGLYENVKDARADARQLSRLLQMKVQPVRLSLRNELVESVLFPEKAPSRMSASGHSLPLPQKKLN